MLRRLDVKEAATRWVRGLPMRWAIGGLVLGVTWTLVTSAGVSDPVGGHLAGVVRVLLIIVLPFVVLGFLWGWSERHYLERWSVQSSEGLNKAHYSLRHVGKAIICGGLSQSVNHAHFQRDGGNKKSYQHRTQKTINS
jgi:hypothetical protein